MLTHANRVGGVENGTISTYTLLECIRQVTIERRGVTDVVMDVAVWRTMWLGTVGRAMLSESRRQFDDMTDEFLNDYLAVNPKK